jgi:hypothetical protein
MVDFKQMLKKSRAKAEIVTIVIRAHEDPNYTNEELLHEIDEIIETLTK